MPEMDSLLAIQLELKVPKNQFNKYGNFKYRSCEDILEALKPILAKFNANLTLSDTIVLVGQWLFVKTTATLIVGGKTYTVDAWAGIDQDRKGMDFAQQTGSASSYARKYALNGLFLIDDARDSDAQEPPAPATLPAGYGVAPAVGAIPPPPPPGVTVLPYRPNPPVGGRIN